MSAGVRDPQLIGWHVRPMRGINGLQRNVSAAGSLHRHSTDIERRLAPSVRMPSKAPVAARMTKPDTITGGHHVLSHTAKLRYTHVVCRLRSHPLIEIPLIEQPLTADLQFCPVQSHALVEISADCVCLHRVLTVLDDRSHT